MIFATSPFANVRKKRDKSNAEAPTAVASGAAFSDHQLLLLLCSSDDLAGKTNSFFNRIASSFKIFAFEGITSVNLLWETKWASSSSSSSDTFLLLSLEGGFLLFEN